MVALFVFIAVFAYLALGITTEVAMRLLFRYPDANCDLTDDAWVVLFWPLLAVVGVFFGVSLALGWAARHLTDRVVR